MPRVHTQAVAVLLMGAALLAGCSGNAEKPPPKEEPKGDDNALVLPGPEAKRKQQTVQFLGSQGTGRRFCIIADSTLSLSPASFALIKREILKTLRSLDEESQFHVMFFADKPYPMPGGDWLRGQKEVESIAPWIEKQPRILKTIAAPAFEKAFALTPRPDVIFFMTDGMIQAKDPALIAAMNKEEPRVVVHTILFTRTAEIAGPTSKARATLERVAKEAGGTFTQFVDPEVLPLKEPPKKKKK